MIFINGQVRRNLQEQVGYNAEQIDKIWQFLDGLNVSDNVIVLASGSGTLTAEELETVKREVSFIIYNNNLYIKTSKSASTLTFKQVALNVSDQGSYNILQSFKIEVTLSNGAYAYASNTILSLYNKAEMDTLLGTKADTSYVDTELAKKANLTGANFTGPITSPSITEDMSGYSFEKDSINANITLNVTYASVVKTGNKITFVWALEVTRTDTVDSGFSRLGNFIIPASIGAKLYPYTLEWSTDIISSKEMVCFSSLSTSVTISGQVIKDGIQQIGLIGFGINALTTNTPYIIRHEVTFLLSDNLAS